MSVALPAVTGAATAARGFRLSREHLNLIAALAKRDYPREVCGFIMRRGSHVEIRIAKNVAAEPEHQFSVDTETMKRAADHMRVGWCLDAIFHSHPNGLMELSEGDKMGAVVGGRALYPNVVYIVVTLTENPTKTGEWFTSATAWIWNEHDSTPSPLKLVVHSG